MSIIKILSQKAMQYLLISVPIEVLGLQQKNCLVGAEKIRLQSSTILLFIDIFLLSGSF